MTKNSENTRPSKSLRCAIYTRKSTEEGLDQEFNSLEAQREASEAFISSQRREGWLCLPHRYDDGGFTGANMDRPALKKLLEAVEAGHVDCVVVYKVDRLSRSLLDFARMLSLFEKHGVSFVAVTQQFNTSTSLGRLTLNILLSFAQFERELIGERTRDKMSAARQKGKWVGGCPVLGYDVHPGGGRLVVNETEAGRVRDIFHIFEQSGSVLLTLQEINRRGWQMKSWIRKTGESRIGGPFTLNSLRRFLRNVLYTGSIRHKGQIFPGDHDAILEFSTWERIQHLIHPRVPLDTARTSDKHRALLSGLLYCQPCAARMVFTYSIKNRRRYPYYVCLNAQRNGRSNCPSKSLPASKIETSVVSRLRSAPQDQATLPGWDRIDQNERIVALQRIIERIWYDGRAGKVSIRFRDPEAAHSEEISNAH